MRVQRNGKVKRSASEWRTILARFEKSGLSQAAFCRREKLAKGSFSNWKKRLEDLGDEATETAPFVELSRTSAMAVPEETQSLQAGELELRLPGGVQLRWRV